MERKLIKVCEKLLFTKTKISVRNFRKNWRSQHEIFRAIVGTLVAFLQTLPKNLALFQALEPAFEYILQEQLAIPKEYQEFILRAEKLEFKKHITSYELAGAFYVFLNYKHLFTENFRNIIFSRYLDYSMDMDEDFSIGRGNDIYFNELHWFLGRMWLKYGDVKNVTYEIKCDAYLEDLDRHFTNLFVVSPKPFDMFKDMCLSLLSKSRMEFIKIYDDPESTYIMFDN